MKRQLLRKEFKEIRGISYVVIRWIMFRKREKPGKGKGRCGWTGVSNGRTSR